MTLTQKEKNNMAIDLAKMRAKLEAVKNRGGKAGFWKPPEGESTIRIIPTKDGDPFKDFHFHYNVGKSSGFLCPKRNYGDDCPVCEFATKLYKESTEDSVKMAICS